MTGTLSPFAGSATAPALAGSGRASFGQASASSMGMKWSALHDAAGIVATLAGMAPEPMTAELRNFPAVIRDAGGWQREMAAQGVDDLSAIMETGIGALLAVHARGIGPVGVGAESQRHAPPVLKRLARFPVCS